MTILSELLAATEPFPHVQLRAGASALMQELGVRLFRDDESYAPQGVDRLAIVPLRGGAVEAGARGLAWIILRLENTQSWTVELHVRRHDDERTRLVKPVLAQGRLVGPGDVTVALQRFVAELHGRQALPQQQAVL